MHGMLPHPQILPNFWYCTLKIILIVRGLGKMYASWGQDYTMVGGARDMGDVINEIEKFADRNT